MSDQSAWQGFRREIEEAQGLLKHCLQPPTEGGDADSLASALPNLLEQCREMVSLSDLRPARSMRSIHHFACTGGTLISRCIAAMANTQVLSEADPLSSMTVDQWFVPTDLIGLAKYGSRPPGQDVLVNIFLAGLRVLSDEAHQSGFDLILRDHSHGHFCLGDAIPERPSLRDMIKPHYRLHSLVSVRHPLDSYISLQKLDWLRFRPGTLEEYAHRYECFLDHYEGIDILRYEDFVVDPAAQMKRICKILALSYNEDFQQVFSAQTLSGDSGRRGNIISVRARRPILKETLADLDNSPGYASLCARLGYNPSPEAPAMDATERSGG